MHKTSKTFQVIETGFMVEAPRAENVKATAIPFIRWVIDLENTEKKSAGSAKAALE
jgi:hypothetical protein